MIISPNCEDVSLASLWYNSMCDKCIKNPVVLFFYEIARALHRQFKICYSKLAGNFLIMICGKIKRLQESDHIFKSDGNSLNFDELKTNFGLK